MTAIKVILLLILHPVLCLLMYVTLFICVYVYNGQHAYMQIQTTPTSSVSSLLPCKVTYSGVNISWDICFIITHKCTHYVGKKREVVKTEDDSVPLPDPFPLPKYYSREVETALERGQLPRKERRIFLSGIASSMLRFKRYPTRDDYISVCCAICRAYPFLKATSGRPYVSFYALLITNIILFCSSGSTFPRVGKQI